MCGFLSQEQKTKIIRYFFKILPIMRSYREICCGFLAEVEADSFVYWLTFKNYANQTTVEAIYN